jgi:hypothetical protein
MLLATPAYLLPPNEAARLRSLHACGILPAPPERVFSELVACSARVFGLPMALLALVDAEQVVYKAKCGIAGPRVYPRAETFCAIAVQQNQSLIFCDVAHAQHACLTKAAAARARAAGVRFYAGVPLRTPDEYPLGALCVLGYEPRRFRAEELHLLEQIAAVLGLLIATRHACLTTPQLGWAHWQLVEDELAKEAHALSALGHKLLAPVDGWPAGLPGVLGQLEARLRAMRELLQDYSVAYAPSASA